MNLAWTADGTAGPAGPTSDASTPALRRLSEVWDNTEPGTVDREVGIRRLYERRHADMVRFAAFLTGDVDGAEDVAHEAFARVFDAWERIADHDRLDAYLKATVVNLVRDGHRRRRPDRATERHLSAVPSAEEDAIEEFRRQRTLRAVAGLPLRQRACVVMRHWMRMSESEIAETLEVSVGSVRTHVKRGMKSLEQRLGEAS